MGVYQMKVEVTPDTTELRITNATDDKTALAYEHPLDAAQSTASVGLSVFWLNAGTRALFSNFHYGPRS